MHSELNKEIVMCAAFSREVFLERFMNMFIVFVKNPCDMVNSFVNCITCGECKPCGLILKAM